MLKLNIRPLNEDDFVAGEENVSLVLSITAGGNVVDADITVEGVEGIIGEFEGSPTVTFDVVKAGKIVIKASKEGYEDGLLELQVPEAETPEPEPTPEPEEPEDVPPAPEPTPTPEPELPVGEDDAIVQFAESLKMGFIMRNLDEGSLTEILSGLSTLESCVASETDDVTKAAAQEILNLVTPQIPELEKKVRQERTNRENIKIALDSSREAETEVAELRPLVEEIGAKADSALNKATVAEETANRIVVQTDEDLQRVADEAVRKAMSKKKLVFL